MICPEAWAEARYVSALAAHPTGVVVKVQVQARAAKNRLLGQHDRRLKIALTAPPVDGAANAALVTFLAELLDVPHGTVSLRFGAKSRTKQVFIQTSAPTRIDRRLHALVARLDNKKRDD